MAKTLAQVQAELVTVNAAIQEVISGTRLTQLRVGSGDFARLYVNQEVSLESLYAIQALLLAEEQQLVSSDGIKFRKETHIPLVVTKFR